MAVDMQASLFQHTRVHVPALQFVPLCSSAVTIHKFVRDKYSMRFPELESLVPTPLEYIRTIQVHCF